MKNEILILAVGALLMGNLAKADVDKVAGKTVSYICKNEVLKEFKLTSYKSLKTTIQFSDQKLNLYFSGSEVQPIKFVKANSESLIGYHISKNSQILAKLNIFEEKVSFGSGCGEHTRAPCFEPIYMTNINAELIMSGISYDFVCSKN